MPNRRTSLAFAFAICSAVRKALFGVLIGIFHPVLGISRAPLVASVSYRANGLRAQFKLREITHMLIIARRHSEGVLGAKCSSRAHLQSQPSARN
jgi:hypothetical protein